MKVLIKYTFIFEPAETWSSFSQFDDALMKMLDSIGMQGVMIKDMEDESRKIIEVVKKVEAPKVAEPEKSVKAQKYSLMAKKGYDGKFVKIT